MKFKGTSFLVSGLSIKKTAILVILWHKKKPTQANTIKMIPYENCISGKMEKFYAILVKLNKNTNRTFVSPFSVCNVYTQLLIG